MPAGRPRKKETEEMMSVTFRLPVGVLREFDHLSINNSCRNRWQMLKILIKSYKKVTRKVEREKAIKKRAVGGTVDLSHGATSETIEG